jgi:hypothetical protein
MRIAGWRSREMLQRYGASAADARASTVVLGAELIGGEIPDTRFRIRRRFRAEDPIDLAAPLAYSVEVLAADDDPEDLDRRRPGPLPGHRPPPIRMPTAPATVNRAMVGERAWHDPPGKVLDRGSPNPSMEPRMSRWFARRH